MTYKSNLFLLVLLLCSISNNVYSNSLGDSAFESKLLKGKFLKNNDRFLDAGTSTAFNKDLADLSYCDMKIETSIKKPSCPKSEDGSITIIVSNAKPPFKVSWDGPVSGIFETSEIKFAITELPAGTYKIAIEDTEGCSKLGTITIEDPEEFKFNAAQLSPTCTGGSTGEILVSNYVNGVGPYDISWNGPGSNDGTKFGVNGNYTISNLPAGNYTVSVVDSKGCSFVNIIAVKSDGSLNVNIVGDLVFCYETGATVLSTSPSSFKTYLWSNGTTASSLSVSSSGTYSVTVSDANGCKGSASVNVVKLPPIKIDLNTNTSILSESCPGKCDGKIFIKVSGGQESSGYGYKWTGPDGFTSDVEDISGLCVGEYKLTVTDKEGCKKTFETIIQKADDINFSVTTIPTSCSNTNDGRINASFSGGKPPYNISWSGAETGSASNVSSVHSINGLDAGNYSLTLSDANGCSKVRTVAVTKPAPFSFMASEFSPSCKGSNTGSIKVENIINGKAPYTIIWEDEFGNDDSGITNGTSYTISNLISGVYNVIIKDDNGCDFIVKEIKVNEQSQINVSIIGDLIFCADQKDGVLATNPSDFSFKWSTGATSKQINISSPGTYSVTVTDSGGCTGVDAVTVTIASDIVVQTSASNSNLSVSCEGSCDGKISPNVSGGTGSAYTYQWAGPSGFTSTAKNISELCSGNYTLTVTDENGCSASYTQVISSGSSFDIDLTPKSTSCEGQKDGSISTKIIGGIAPFNYNWSNGASTQNLENISGGTYKVTITDSKGCIAQESVVVGEGSAINGIVNPLNSTICLGEKVTLKASGGSNYLWSTGQTSSSIDVSPSINTTYSVTISGSGGSCAVVKSAIVNVNDLEDAKISVSETSGLHNNDGDICEGSSVTLNASGGSSYIWSGGFSNPLVDIPSDDKTYVVTITDDIGCSKVLNQTINVNKKPDAIIDVSDVNQVLSEAQVIKNSSISNCGALIDCSWSIDGTVKSNDCGDISQIFNSEGTYEIALEVENDCGCTDNTKKVIDIFSGDACKIKAFSINDDVGDACINESVPINIVSEASEGCNNSISRINATKDGVPVTSFNFENDIITFFETGIYDIEYVYEDDCSCRRTTKRQIKIVEAPDVQFAADNITMGCAGEIITIKFDNYNFGEKITIQFGNVEKTYESDAIDLFLSETGVIPLRIIRVSNSVCNLEVDDQIININVIEPFQIASRSFTCDESGLYTLTLRTIGGIESAPIQSTIFGVQNGDNYVISGLNPNMEFSFTMSRGEFCNPIEVYQPLVSCNCLFEPGTLDLTYYLGCAGEYFDISDIYSGSDAVNNLLDTALYVLHDGALDSRSLGQVFEIYPITQTFITNNFENYTPNKEYTLSVLGIRKFDFNNLDVNDKTTFDFKGEGDCFSLSNGIPVIWHSSQLSISGPSEVCENAYNEIFVSTGIGDGAELNIEIPGLTSENYTFNEADGKLYVHFVNDTEVQVPINIVSTTYHTDIIYDEFYETTCVNEVNYLVDINQEHRAPDTSNVILWPGGIFASTDTLDNICYRWGKTTRVSNSVVKDTFFEGADERFYFADINDVEGLNERRQIWVETYFCDDPTCATRNIFNGEFPISLEESFSESGISVYPNPSNGLYNLKINNGYRGEVGIVLYDIRGRHIYKSNFDKSGLIVNKRLNLQEIPSGVYILKTTFDGVNFNDKLIKH